MSIAQSQIAAAPFDAVATRYDESFTYSKIGKAQRAAVWRELAKTFHAGDRVLEIGCGTGVDACFLAERGVRIVALDPSSQMIQEMTRRVEQKDLNGLVQPYVHSANDLASFQSAELFDGAFSNFGAINCVEDLRKLAIDLSKLLRPGAAALLCWMGPYCVWELIWYWLHGRKEKAFRRLKRNGVSVRIADGVFIRVRYPSVEYLKRTFAPEFRLTAIRGIGVAVPPSYMEAWVRCHPGWLPTFERADLCLARFPGLRILGDHVLVRLERKTKVSARQ